MKAMKMKALAVAVLGLAAGSAWACPSGPAVADGGAWTSKLQLSGGTVTVATPGLDSSLCKLVAQIPASFAAVAAVRDTTPANETRYRFQFLVDPTGLSSFGLTDGVQIFTANAATAFPVSGGRVPMLALALSPGAAAGSKRITIIASCSGGSNYRCATSIPVDLTAGVNRIEVDLTVGAGAAGTARYWLNAASGTTEPAVTGTLSNLDNAGWVGVDTAILGLSGPTPTFRTAHAAQSVGFDSFDSRRQTYIGY